MKELLIGRRIPKDYFVAKGKGESDITVHSGSFYLALKNAGIENSNILTHSSILPAISREVPKPKNMTRGAGMETIMACSTSTKGKRATAPIIVGWLYEKKAGKNYGGLVCEYNGPKTIVNAEKELRQSIEELYTDGFEEEYDLKDIRFHSETIVPRKKYGTVGVPCVS